MSSLPGASEQQRVLRSPFDIETHKATFVNYLEVCIDEGGTPHYAVPSHQEWLVRKLMRLRGFVEQGQASRRTGAGRCRRASRSGDTGPTRGVRPFPTGNGHSASGTSTSTMIASA